jgi:hypothetical protein
MCFGIGIDEPTWESILVIVDDGPKVVETVSGLSKSFC